MELIVNKQDFLHLLQNGGTFAKPHKTLPILENVNVEIKSGKLYVTSYDNENMITARGSFESCDVDNYSFLLNLKNVLGYIKLCSNNNPINIKVDEKQCQISQGKSKYSLPIADSDEFPELKVEDISNYITLPTSDLSKMIGEAFKFVASDDLRPVMNGVLLYNNNGELGTASSNGHYLYDNYVKSEISEDIRVIIPKTASVALQGVLECVDEVSFGTNDRIAVFRGGDYRLIVRLIEGKYPNARSVVPKSNEINVYLNKNDLISSVKRACFSASQSSMLLEFNVSGSELKILSRDMDFGVSGEESLPCESNGDVRIGFKANFLLELLSVVKDSNTTLKLKDGSCAGLIMSDGEPNKVLLLMPMKLD